MITTLCHIDDEMVKAAGEPIAKAERFSDVAGLVFLHTVAGKVAIYNSEVQQALKRRFDSIAAAREFAIAKLCSKVR